MRLALAILCAVSATCCAPWSTAGFGARCGWDGDCHRYGLQFRCYQIVGEREGRGACDTVRP